jgi:hypothetical protein
MTEEIKNPAGSTETTAPRSAGEIAEIVLGHIDWLDTEQGYCDCPEKAAHTNTNGKRDCMVYLDNIPTVYCVHSSCKSLIAATNLKLRKAFLQGVAEKPHRLTIEEKQKLAEREHKQRIRERAANALPQILHDYAWPYQQICRDSKAQLAGRQPQHWRFLLKEFNCDDVVWIGDKFDSGKPEHANHFKTVVEWLNENEAAGPLICPAVFKNNSIARSNENIIARRFLVVESDVLSKDEVGAIFKWLKDAVELELVAVVDTAGKSLHGWFAYPEDYEVEDLKLVLPAYGCDPKLFTASQPVRLPGALRDGKFQTLIYVNGEVGDE